MLGENAPCLNHLVNRMLMSQVTAWSDDPIFLHLQPSFPQPLLFSYSSYVMCFLIVILLFPDVPIENKLSWFLCLQAT